MAVASCHGRLGKHSLRKSGGYFGKYDFNDLKASQRTFSPPLLSNGEDLFLFDSHRGSGESATVRTACTSLVKGSLGYSLPLDHQAPNLSFEAISNSILN